MCRSWAATTSTTAEGGTTSRSDTKCRPSLPSLPPLPCIFNRKNAAKGQIAIAERVACQWLLGNHNGLRVLKPEAGLEWHSEPLDPEVGPVGALSFPGAPLLIVVSSTPTRSSIQSKSSASARNIPPPAIPA